jgi:hypothetical protein
MSEHEPLYCAEQIQVPDELPDVLKQWTKEVIRANPSNIAEWSAEYFAEKAKQWEEERKEKL